MKNTKGLVADERSDLVEEWCATKNGENTPNTLRAGSDKNIKWPCKECRHWQI